MCNYRYILEKGTIISKCRQGQLLRASSYSTYVSRAIDVNKPYMVKEYLSSLHILSTAKNFKFCSSVTVL